MRPRIEGKPLLQAEAVVRWVDPVNRELAALVEGAAITIDVPLRCAVVLRGEPVKLRMVQPGDRLHVAYTEQADTLIARAIEVQPAGSSASLTL